MFESPAYVSPWQPKWKVDVGHGCEVGVTIDDHCLMALIPTHKMTNGEIEFTGEWKPTPWIPKAVAEFMATKVAEA